MILLEGTSAFLFIRPRGGLVEESVSIAMVGLVLSGLVKMLIHACIADSSVTTLRI